MCIKIMSGMQEFHLEELPFDPADATEPIVHIDFWVSVNGAGERLEHHKKDWSL